MAYSAYHKACNRAEFQQARTTTYGTSQNKPEFGLIWATISTKPEYRLSLATISTRPI